MLKSYPKILSPDTTAKARCEHDYNEVYSDFDSESWECSKCGDRYKLYYEDMQ